MNRFFVGPSDIGTDTIEITDRNDIKHISKVLRLRAGDELEISDSVKFEYAAKIISANQSSILLKILDKQGFAREPEIKVTLYQGLPKLGKMDSIIQKSVELGVHSIVPVFTARSVVMEKQDFEKKLKRWNKISAEAVKQCKRGVVPEVRDVTNFNEMISELNRYDLALLPYEDEENTSIKNALKDLKNPVKKIALIIGPEGGFSKDEARMVVDGGGVSVSLGKTILRTETAGPAALAMIMYELELQ